MWTPKDVIQLVGEIVPVALAMIAYLKAKAAGKDADSAHARIDQAKQDIRDTNKSLLELAASATPAEVVAAAIAPRTEVKTDAVVNSK